MKNELVAEERDNQVKLLTEVIGGIVVLNPQFLEATSAVAQHLRQEHGYTVSEALLETASIVEDAYKLTGSLSTEAARGVANEKSRQGS